MNGWKSVSVEGLREERESVWERGREEIGTNTPQTIVRQGKQGRVMRALFVDLP